MSPHDFTNFLSLWRMDKNAPSGWVRYQSQTCTGCGLAVFAVSLDEGMTYGVWHEEKTGRVVSKDCNQEKMRVLEHVMES
jgi:hypothetical protein